MTNIPKKLDEAHMCPVEAYSILSVEEINEIRERLADIAKNSVENTLQDLKNN